MTPGLQPSPNLLKDTQGVALGWYEVAPLVLGVARSVVVFRGRWIEFDGVGPLAPLPGRENCGVDSRG